MGPEIVVPATTVIGYVVIGFVAARLEFLSAIKKNPGRPTGPGSSIRGDMFFTGMLWWIPMTLYVFDAIGNALTREPRERPVDSKTSEPERELGISDGS